MATDAGLIWAGQSVPLAGSHGVAQGLGVAGPGSHPLSSWQVFETPHASTDPPAVWEAVERALAMPEVAYAEPDAIFELPLPETIVPPRAGPSPTWHLDAINVPAAWKASRARGIEPAEGIVIAHIDTGFTKHPAVPSARFMTDGFDFWSGSASAIDPLTEGFLLQPGHGTGTLGLLASDYAVQPYQGVATHARILPIRVSPSVVLVRTAAFAGGLTHAVDAGATVVSISMGGLPSQLWADAVNYAYDRGVVMCAAAGNHYRIGPFRTPSGVVYPARFERVIAVSGITKNEKRYRFPKRMSGNDGPEVGLCAPTPDVEWARVPGPDKFDFGPGEGTSTATPQVAGAAAMWLAYHAKALAGMPARSRVEACRVALLRGAQKVGERPYAPVGDTGRTRNDWFGDGRLDIAATLKVEPQKGLARAPRASIVGAFGALVGWGVAGPEIAGPEGAAARAARIRAAWSDG